MSAPAGRATPGTTPGTTAGTDPGAGAGAPWWRTAVVHQVYPRSFADSTGDGVGDLPGVTAHLDHLADLGVDGLWLSPVYASPMNDGGYDVADYRSIDPVFGTLADADALVAAAHARGLRVLMDLVPNHTSSDHAWFREALAAAPGSEERARYLFRDGRGPGGDQPPNDWRSVFGGPAWDRVVEADGAPGQWYLHLFDATQPDLDWSNPQVRAELEDVIRFWLDRGVDGFRVDVAHGLVKAEGLPDWDPDVPPGATTAPLADGAPDGPADPSPGSGRAQRRAPMWDQEGVHEVYRSWRALVDSYDGDRTLVAEAWVEPAERMARYVRPDEMQQTFAFQLLAAPWEAGALREGISQALATTAAVGASATWVLSNHDVVRHTTRLALPPADDLHAGVLPTQEQPDEALGLRRGRAATLVMLALPGAAYLYQGEELGLPEHTTLPDDVRCDPSFAREGGRIAGRDGCRVPLPWVAGAEGFGFGPSGATWLPQPPSWARYAADVERDDPASTLSMYREALALRRSRGLGGGSLTWREDLGPQVLALTVAGVLVVANLGSGPVPVPAGAQVLLASGPLPGGEIPVDTTAWLTLP